jgi:hypothetical protein
VDQRYRRCWRIGSCDARATTVTRCAESRHDIALLRAL